MLCPEIIRLRLKRARQLLLILLVVLVLAVVAALQFTGLEGQPARPLSATGRSRRCGIRGDFTQAGVDAACAPAAMAPCRVVNIGDLDQSGFVESRLRLRGGSVLRIFVFPPFDLISGHVMRNGGWEGPSVGFLTRALRAWPRSALVDVGSGVGVFSLHAARFGRKVLAIDANYQNAIRLAKSVESNGYSQHVQVYWNAVSNLPAGTRLYMRLPPDCNLGGGEPALAVTKGRESGNDLADDIRVRAAGLDLVTTTGAAAEHLADASAVFLKLDIEGHEWLAFATGKRLFSRHTVPLVMMEWSVLRDGPPDRAGLVLRFLTTRGFRPYVLADGGREGSRPKPLEPAYWRAWPGDVLWARNITQLIASWQ